MSGEDPIGLDSIRVPDASASDQPDDLTKKEAKHNRRPKGPTPTEQLRTYLDGQLAELKEENKSLRGELDRLRPRYTALVESRRALASNGNAAAALLILGGCLQGAAGYVADAALKAVVFGIGSSMIGVGCWLHFRASQRARGLKHDHLEEGLER